MGVSSALEVATPHDMPSRSIRTPDPAPPAPPPPVDCAPPMRGRSGAATASLSASLRTTWVDRVAHDLRGPLAPMQTAAYLLRDPSIDPAQRAELLDLLEQQIQRLGEMVGEVSDFGRAEAGRLIARRETVDIESLACSLEGHAQAGAPRLTLDPSARGVQIEGDVLRIVQMFRLLLDVRLARGEAAPVRARLDSNGRRLRMTCTVPCPDASDGLVALLLAAPHPDPPDGSLGFGLVIAGAIAAAHGGTLRGRARDACSVELVLELPCAAPAYRTPAAAS